LPPLVESKLLAPRQRGGLVERPHVAGLLDGADGAALLSAPTGYEEDHCGEGLVIEGELDDRFTSAFKGMALNARQGPRSLPARPRTRHSFKACCSALPTSA
jgi:hypothetical protein